MLRHLPAPEHADLIVGTDTGDDAAVWRRPDGRALVSTADFFTPLVDDPATWGRIAAANAASDVYAMGGTPLFALALVAWPRDALPLELLAEVLAAGSELAAEGGWVVAGGHTVDGPEPMYGQAVTGEVDLDRLVTNAGARPGQHLVLTKALGTGVVTTAVKRLEPEAVADGGEIHEAYTEAVASMTRLNADGAEAMADAGATAGTDVTGFGLLGHLQKMVAASGCGAVLDVASVPRLPGVRELVEHGHVPGGTERNLDHVRPHLDAGATTSEQLTLLADAQTSGGLVFAADEAAAQEAADRLRRSGHTAAVIGELTAGHPGRIVLR